MTNANEGVTFEPEQEVEEYEQEWENLPLDEIYTVVVLGYVAKQSRFKDKEGNAKTDLMWTLGIDAPKEHVGRQLTYWTPSKISRNPRTGKANKLLSFIETLNPGKKFETGQKINLQDLTAKTCRVTLQDKQLSDGRAWQSIGTLIPEKKK